MSTDPGLRALSLCSSIAFGFAVIFVLPVFIFSISGRMTYTDAHTNTEQTQKQVQEADPTNGEWLADQTAGTYGGTVASKYRRDSVTGEVLQNAPGRTPANQPAGEVTYCLNLSSQTTYASSALHICAVPQTEWTELSPGDYYSGSGVVVN